ncbi:MAG: FAD-binding oxidoreductase [Thermoplasmatota archaeon]
MTHDPDPEQRLDGWGFGDTAFEARADDTVVLTGDRYPLCGDALPHLLPWIRDVMEIDLPVDDLHQPAYPPKIPAPKRNAKLYKALEAVVGDDWTQDGATRLRHGHGHTLEEMYAIQHGALGRVPDIVVWPRSTEDVEAIIAAAKKHNGVVIPYGGGTNVTDALRCDEGEARTIVSVDMRKMDQILWIDEDNRMACIQAGAVGRHIQEQLAEKGYTLGHEPDSIEFSTLGGWIATHASGMKKNKYGNIEDIVLDVHVVTADGTLSRPQIAPRESAGLDLRRWIFGSEGTLGIVTQAVVKIFPLPEVQEYDSVLFPNFEQGVAFLQDLTRSGQLPASVRLVDNVQFHFGQALKPASEGAKALVSKAQKFFVTKVKGFDPHQMVACTFVHEGTKDGVALEKKTVAKLAKRHGGMMAGPENGRRGYTLTFGIAYIRDFVMKHWILGESFETSVPWDKAIELCDRVKQRIHDECAARGVPGKPFATARITQLYPTGVAVYFYFGFHHKGLDEPQQIYMDIEAAAREEILACGGSISHHHGIGKIRQRFLPDVFSPTTLQWAKGFKNAVDPENIFAAGNQALGQK